MELTVIITLTTVLITHVNTEELAAMKLMIKTAFVYLVSQEKTVELMLINAL